MPAYTKKALQALWLTYSHFSFPIFFIKKNIFWCALCTFFVGLCTPTFAQKVNYNRKEKTLYVDEKPYIKIEKMGGLNSSDYSIKTLTDKELIVFRYQNEKGFFEVFFMETGEKAYYNQHAAIGLGAKNFGKVVLENKLVKNDAIDEEAKKRYILLNGTEPAPKMPQTVNSTNTVPANNPNTLVQRNRQADILVFGSVIKQDFKNIGTFSTGTLLGSGVVHNIVTVKLPDGTVVAEAKSENITSENFEIFTMADRRRARIRVKFSTNAIEDIAKYLVENYYL